MEIIKFVDLNQRPGYIEFICQTSDSSTTSDSSIFFELKPEVSPSKDAIAAAMACMAGQKYEEIYFDFEISKYAKESIETFTKAHVYSLSVVERDKMVSGDNIILNFSGGFDSLAAYCIMPQNTKLVAVNWGGTLRVKKNFSNDLCLIHCAQILGNNGLTGIPGLSCV